MKALGIYNISWCFDRVWEHILKSTIKKTLVSIIH